MSATREQLIRELVADACRAAQWGGPFASAPERLAESIRAHRLDVEADGVRLLAELDENANLTLRVRIRCEWNRRVEVALRRALETSGAQLGRLVLTRWEEVCAACMALSTKGRSSR